MPKPHPDANHLRPLALVTGAGRGLGRSIALALAAAGYDLILVARTQLELLEVADLARRAGREVQLIPVDLSQPQAAEAVLAALPRCPDVVINNAAAGGGGDFTAAAPQALLQQLQLNILTPVLLTRGLLVGMRERGSGTIVNIASMASFHAAPGMAVYGAGKGFLRQWSEALWQENLEFGVHVLALCPGPLATGFNQRHGMAVRRGARLQAPDLVAQQVLQALRRPRPVIVLSRRDHWAAVLFGLLPVRLRLKLTARILGAKTSVHIE